MDKLRTYINSLPKADKDPFALNCKTTLAYLRKAISSKPKFGVEICIAIEKATNGLVRCEDLRPDVDWAYLRGTKPRSQAHD